MAQYFAVQWHITDVCDQRCKHCYIFSEGHDELISTSMENLEITYEKIKDFCKKIDRIPYIYLTGGDPILHPNFWQLLELFHRDNTRYCIMGNPFHLTNEICKKLHDLGCVKYQLSLDGFEQTHDSFRKPGSFKATIEAIKMIRRSGMWCAIMTTVSKVNMKEVPDLIDYVFDLGVDVYAVGRYCPTSVEKAYDEHNHITPLEYKEFLEICYKKYYAYKDLGTTYHLKDHLWTLFLYEKGLYKLPSDESEISGCNCGRNHITILPNGDVYACRRFDSKVGNINIDSLYELWQTKMNKYRHLELFKKCSKCKLRNVCRGCPAVAYGYSHYFYGEDPQCWLEIKGD